jgi:predicted regulator of Ras-like GTPase activity (Roadblock/LC7/MglB family)
MSKLSDFTRFNAETMQSAQAHCDELLNNVAGLDAVVLATVDGFDIVNAIQTRLKAERLAALASSIAAIGQVVALEGSLGQSKRIIIDGEFGYAMVCSIDRTDIGIVFILLASKEALLGQLNVSALSSSQFFKSIPVLA